MNKTERILIAFLLTTLSVTSFIIGFQLTPQKRKVPLNFVSHRILQDVSTENSVYFDIEAYTSYFKHCMIRRSKLVLCVIKDCEVENSIIKGSYIINCTLVGTIIDETTIIKENLQ